MDKGVFFDICGTLFRYGNLDEAWTRWQDIVYQCFKNYGLTMEKEEFFKSCTPNILDGEAPDINNDGLTILGRKFKNFSLSLHLDLNDEQIWDVSEKSVHTWGNYLKLEENTLSILKELKKKNTLALITNFDHPPFIRWLLDKYKMLDFFDSVVISGEVGCEKPNAEIFLLALNETSLKAKDIVYVGDGAVDIEGARAANIKPILINRDGKDIKGDFYKGVEIITDLKELIK